MRLLRQCIFALLCLGATPATGAGEEWNLWFAEYDAVGVKSVTRQPALFLFKHRAVPATKGASPKSVERYEIARGWEVYRHNGAYFADTLPLFAPTQRQLSIAGDEYDCDSVPESHGYAVTCRSNYSGYVLKSFYEPDKGIRWFEYFCGHPSQVCRFELAKGKPLFRPDFIKALERSGEIRAREASRGRARQ